jgi:hypothetical protein
MVHQMITSADTSPKEDIGVINAVNGSNMDTEGDELDKEVDLSMSGTLPKRRFTMSDFNSGH